jgi:hypothetical protein
MATLGHTISELGLNAEWLMRAMISMFKPFFHGNVLRSDSLNSRPRQTA